MASHAAFSFVEVARPLVGVVLLDVGAAAGGDDLLGVVEVVAAKGLGEDRCATREAGGEVLRPGVAIFGGATEDAEDTCPL